ncbi:MAG: L-threonylcarbamoyladenylate synthase [Fastidiosipilaceae bacterium]|nr:threonylcarbamoyl-AMP synthase [Clostridiaceae bacterium]
MTNRIKKTQVINAKPLVEHKISKEERDQLTETLLTAPATALANGEVVAFPTETVYGLGANINCPEAVDEIFSIKGRPNDNPLIVHVGTKEAIKPLVQSFPEVAEVLVEELMPGPLTLVLPRSDIVPDNVTAGLDTVGIRMPNHPVTRQLLILADVPVAAPSANLSGKPSPTLAEHVVHDLQGKVNFIVDGGPCQVGVESTVLDLSSGPPLILRPGGVTASSILRCLENHHIQFPQRDWQIRLLHSGSGYSVADHEVPKSPGMKYRHYAPDGIVKIIEGNDRSECITNILKFINESNIKDNFYGIFANQEFIDEVKARLPGETNLIQYSYGPVPDIRKATHELFAGLRFLDEHSAKWIFVETFPDQGIGTAYMNRLLKASGDTSNRTE